MQGKPLFTPAELENIRQEAKAQVAVMLKEKLVNDAIEKLSTTSKEKDEDWLFADMPNPSEEFGEAHVYGFTFRVNKTGTSVQILIDGVWIDRKITTPKGRRSPFITVSNSESNSHNKGGKVSLAVARLVLQAFVEMPDYMKKVQNHPNGNRILFGLHFYRFKDGNTQNINLNNLEYPDRDSFVMAVKLKMSRMKLN